MSRTTLKTCKPCSVVGAVLDELLEAVESDNAVLSVLKPSKKCKFAKKDQLEAAMCIFAENQPQEGATERDIRAYRAGIERSKKRRRAEKSGSSAVKRRPEGEGYLCSQSEMFDLKH